MMILQATTREKDVEMGAVDLGIPQTTLFQLFTQNRRKILEWLLNHPQEKNEVMEAIVQLVTEDRHRKEAVVNYGAFAKHREGLVNRSLIGSRNWVTLTGMNFAGRFVPDNEVVTSLSMKRTSPDAPLTFEEYLRQVRPRYMS
jgi:hypothetical protein